MSNPPVNDLTILRWPHSTFGRPLGWLKVLGAAAKNGRWQLTLSLLLAMLQQRSGSYRGDLWMGQNPASSVSAFCFGFHCNPSTGCGHQQSATTQCLVWDSLGLHSWDLKNKKVMALGVN